MKVYILNVADKGDMFCWGWNEYGQLGLGDTITRDRPHRVTLNSKHVEISNIWCGAWSTVIEVSSRHCLPPSVK